MSQYQRILLLADPSLRRTPAFERAVWLARASGAALHIALFDRDPLISAAALVTDTRHTEAAIAQWLEPRRQWLHAQTDDLIAKGLNVTSEAVWSRPSQHAILQHVDEFKPDLVVKDVHYEPLLRRVLIAPLDWQLLRSCPCPLLLVNTLTRALPKRIVAAVDASSQSSEHRTLNEQVIHQALSMAIQCDAQLHLVYAFSGPQSMIDPAGAGIGPIGELARLLQPQHQQHFDELADAHGVPPDRRHFLHGPAAPTIADFLREHHSDVLVIGSAHRTLFDRLLIGTTAEAMLDAAPCNVLAVKS